MASEWLTAGEARARLGVQAQTLYAYVSRGLIRSERIPGSRSSRYSRGDVERLAQRGRRTSGAPGPEVVVDSALTKLDPAGRLAYRGWDVTDAARTSSFEAVAEWLWGTDDDDEDHSWIAPRDHVRVATRAQAALPADAAIPDRLRVTAAAVGTCDPLRNDRRRASVAARGRALIATLIESLPVVGTQPAPEGGSLAARLWPRLSPLAATLARVQALDHAMVLLADHELAASTLAVRIAASTWADPYLLVSAGLAVAGGPLHGGASEAVRTLLREVTGGTSAAVAVGACMRDARPVPGFGHTVYEGPDPRAPALLSSVRRTRAPRALLRAVDDVQRIVGADGGGLYPNVDYALGAFAEAHDMVPGAGEAIFVTARCAGWIAHGLEEYEHRLRFRIRAAYTGPPPEWA